MSHMHIAFDAGLTVRYGSLLDCLRDCIARSSIPQKEIARTLGISESSLSRRLAAKEPGDREPRFSVDLLEAYLQHFADPTPIYYLVEKFCQKPEDKRRQAISQLAHLMPMLERLVKESAQ